MDILGTISTTSNAVNTIYAVATYDWEKKSLCKLAITTSAFIGLLAIVSCIESNRTMNTQPKTKFKLFKVSK